MENRNSLFIWANVNIMSRANLSRDASLCSNLNGSIYSHLCAPPFGWKLAQSCFQVGPELFLRVVNRESALELDPCACVIPLGHID